MKRVLILLLLAAILASLCACGGKGDTTDMAKNSEGIIDVPEYVRPTCTLVLKVNDLQFYPKLEDNEAAATLMEKLASDELTVAMHDYGGFEKVAALPWALPQSDTELTATAGDIMLYQGDKIVINYGENTWDYTKLARVESRTDELLEALGEGDVTVTLWLEWSE